MCVCAFVVPTCALKTLHCGGESFGSGQQVVFELGQAFTLCYLNTDLVFRLCEAGALAIQQELWREKSHVNTRTADQLICFFRADLSSDY